MQSETSSASYPVSRLLKAEWGIELTELLLVRHGRSLADDEQRIEGGGYDSPLRILAWSKFESSLSDYRERLCSRPWRNVAHIGQTRSWSSHGFALLATAGISIPVAGTAQ
ncbi:MAG: hypothetical protein ACOX4G_14665 [Limnochordia bacterium]|jgi:hypothetical protein